LNLVFGAGDRVPETWDASLSQEDAGLANALLGLCLRRWGRLQAFCLPQLQDPGRGLPLGTQVCLAIGLAQLAWLPGVSDHAAVNESVELAMVREVGFPPHKGLVNAILRKACKDRPALAAALEALDPGLDRSAFTTRVLRAALDARRQLDLDPLWARLQTPPQPHFMALKDEPLPPGLEPARTPEGSQSPVPDGALKLAPQAAFPRDWLARGAGMVQDLSSQALLQFNWERPVTRILDACSAPGGKATVLGRRFPEAELIAVERNPARARRLEDNLRAREIKAEILVEDAAAWMRRGGPGFDLIMLDAPCSGSGTLQKHPELNWLGDGLDLRKLQRTQRELLDAAAARLAPGGLLIYAVCSWLAEEGREHRDWLLNNHTELHTAKVWPLGMGTDNGPTSYFRPDPLTWAGEGFQAFAFVKD
jgi:16S rRNA (cytosine967-C5)-methyltransferase